jgi:sugar lactone lactonase YvrE
VVSAAAALVAASAAQPGARAQSPGLAPGCAPGEVPRTISAISPGLFPEGVAWDPTREAFLVTSALRGNVSVVGTDGCVTELTPGLGTVSTLGLKVDAGRGRVLVAYTDYWLRLLGEISQPPTSGVAVIDLATGEPLARIDTALGRETTSANDVAIDERTGAAYVTDIVSDTLQEIDADGRVTDLVTDERFASDSVGVNGIVWHPDGFLLTTRHDTGAMFRVGLGGETPGVTRVEVSQPLVGVDGLALRQDGTLLAAQIPVETPEGPAGGSAITALASDDGWRSARVAGRADPWPIIAPTAIAVGSLGAYALSGQVGVALSGGTADEFWLRRVGF